MSDRVRLGRTGLHVSRLAFGTMSFGGDADEAESARLYAAARDAGINLFDCADVYSRGRAETILGRLMADHRDEVVVTSKVGMKMHDHDRNFRGSGRRNVARAVEASLRRLATDRIDVLFVHRFDPDVPLEETLRALEIVVAQGKAVHLGASNFAAWQVAKALGISAMRGWAGIEVLQPMYNLVKRQSEVEILPMAMAEDLGVISYSPLGGGLLSGKYGPGRQPPSGRIVDRSDYGARYGEAWVWETAGAFTAFASDHGVHPATLAVAWAMAHPGVTAPIIGGRNVDQARPSLAALDFAIDATVRDAVSALSRTPPSATDRRDEALREAKA